MSGAASRTLSLTIPLATRQPISGTAPDEQRERIARASVPVDPSRLRIAAAIAIRQPGLTTPRAGREKQEGETEECERLRAGKGNGTSCLP